MIGRDVSEDYFIPLSYSFSLLSLSISDVLPTCKSYIHRIVLLFIRNRRPDFIYLKMTGLINFINFMIMAWFYYPYFTHYSIYYDEQ